MCTAHHIGIRPFNVRPPKTRSREEVESRQRRLGRIDSFSRRAAAEPFPGWRLAGAQRPPGSSAGGPSPPPSASRPPPSTMEPRSRPPPLPASPRSTGGLGLQTAENEWIREPSPARFPAPSPQLLAAARWGKRGTRLVRGTAAAARAPTPARLSRSVPPHIPRAAAASSRSPQRPPPPAPGRPGARRCHSLHRAPPNRAQPRAPLPGPRRRREASTAGERERGRGGAGPGARPSRLEGRSAAAAAGRRRRWGAAEAGPGLGAGRGRAGKGQARRGLAGRSVGPSLIPSPPLAASGGRAARSAPALARERHGLFRSARRVLALCLHPPRRRTFK